MNYGRKRSDHVRCHSSSQQNQGAFCAFSQRQDASGQYLYGVGGLALRKSRGGEFFLRIEDLDPVRCPRSFADLILQDLNWLGLTWDNGDVLYQSDRSPVYETYYQLLSDKDLIYPCFCSRSQLHVADAPHAEDGRIIYPGTCRQLSSEESRFAPNTVSPPIGSYCRTQPFPFMTAYMDRSNLTWRRTGAI